MTKTITVIIINGKFKAFKLKENDFLVNYSLGIPDTNFKGLNTRIALNVLRSTSGPFCGNNVMNLRI